MENTIAKECLFTSPKADFWFEALIDKIQSDQTQLRIGMASKEKEDFYSYLIEGNATELFKKNREFNNQYFITKIIVDYVNLLREENIKPSKLAFDYSNSRVLVWAEVENEETEDSLILAQAEINAKYQEYNIYLSSSIVESADNLNIPEHYKKLTN